MTTLGSKKLKENSQTGATYRNKPSSHQSKFTRTLERLRQAASACSAFLDNEIFKIKSVADAQKSQIRSQVEELCNILARKLSYLLSYADQQVEMAVGRLKEEKDRLDLTLVELDKYIDVAGLNVTAEDVETARGALTLKLEEIPSYITLPTVSEPNEMLQTFSSLLQGHICKDEVFIDTDGCRQYNNLFSLPDGPPEFSPNGTPLSRTKELNNSKLSEFSSKAKQKSYDANSHYKIDASVDKENWRPRSTVKAKKPLYIEENDEEPDVDLECHENIEIILPRPITYIAEQADEDDCLNTTN